MNESWAVVVSMVLVTLGLLAELNLLRVFVRDWQAGRREERRTRHATDDAPARGRGPSARSQASSRRRVIAAALAPIAVAGAAHAQPSGAGSETPAQAGAPAAQPPEAAPEPAVKSAYSLQLNLDYTTAYFYHGIIQEDTGLILQPAAKLTVNVHEAGDLKIDAFFGTWNSFHGQKTGSSTRSDFTEYWYESDLIGGFVVAKDKFSLTTAYVILTSPSDAYETVQELDFTLAYNDSELLGKFALHPYALVGIEIGADASDGADSDTGTYLELGIAPGFTFDVGTTPVTLTFPTSVGLSLSDYYQNAAGEDDTFGFFQVGVKASVPLPFAARYGQWTLNAGVSALFLGDHTSEYNNGDHEQLIGMVGLQLNF